MSRSFFPALSTSGSRPCGGRGTACGKTLVWPRGKAWEAAVPCCAAESVTAAGGKAPEEHLAQGNPRMSALEENHSGPTGMKEDPEEA